MFIKDRKTTTKEVALAFNICCSVFYLINLQSLFKKSLFIYCQLKI